MPTSRQTASQLLSIEQQRWIVEPAGSRFLPAVVGVLNVIFCAVMEQYLRSDSSGRYLSLFLLVECSAASLISVGMYMYSMSEIITKTTVLPTSPFSRLLFVATGFFRKGAVIALLSGMLLCLAVSFSSGWIPRILSLILALLAIIDVELIVALICLRLTRASAPIGGFALLSLYGLTGVIVAALLFHADSLLDVIPVVSWAVTGIGAIQNGTVAPALVPASALILVSIGTYILGKRIA